MFYYYRSQENVHDKLRISVEIKHFCCLRNEVGEMCSFNNRDLDYLASNIQVSQGYMSLNMLFAIIVVLRIHTAQPNGSLTSILQEKCSLTPNRGEELLIFTKKGKSCDFL